MVLSSLIHLSSPFFQTLTSRINLSFRLSVLFRRMNRESFSLSCLPSNKHSKGEENSSFGFPLTLPKKPKRENVNFLINGPTESKKENASFLSCFCLPSNKDCQVSFFDSLSELFDLKNSPQNRQKIDKIHSRS